MQSILDNIATAQQTIFPQNVTEFIALQMAIQAGDPFLFRPYLRNIETMGIGRCVEIFKKERKLPIIKQNENEFSNADSHSDNPQPGWNGRIFK